MIVSRKMAEAAAEELGLTLHSALDEPTISMAYRALVKVCHPDAGGDAEMFAAVDRAKHVLMAWLARADRSAPPPHGAADPCPRCRGKGYMELAGARLGSVLRKQCPTCRGSGELYDERETSGDRMS